MIRLNEKRMVEFVPRDISGHQTHFEDLVLLGSNGLEELNDKIEKFLSNSKEDKKLNLTTKIDGAPAVTMYHKFPGYPDNSIQLKSFIQGPGTAMSTEEDIDEKYGDRPDMADKLKKCLKLAKYIPENEAWWGDCLFGENDKKEEEIKGTKYITFHPNKIVYAFSEENDGYDKLKDADFGIAFHTKFTPNGDKKKVSYDLDASNYDFPSWAYIMSPSIPVDNSHFDFEGINKKFEQLKALEDTLQANKSYEELIHNEAFMDFWNTFENANLADKKAVNINVDTFYDELSDYIEEKQTKEFTKKNQTLKTAKGRSNNLDKWVEEVAKMKELLKNNKKTLTNLVNALNLAANIKMELWGGFKGTELGYKTFYKSRTKGVIDANMEGVAMSDMDGNIVKIVDRSEFSSANRDADIMSGWEHPESSNKKLENRQRKNKHLMKEEDGGIKLQDLLNDLHPKAAKGFYRYLVAHNQFFGGGVGKECYYDRYELATEYKSYIKSLIHKRPANSGDEEEYGCDVGDTMFEAYFGDDPTDLIMVGACTTAGGLYTIWDCIEGGVAEDCVHPDDMGDSMVTWTDRAIFNGYPNKVKENTNKLWKKFNKVLESTGSKTLVMAYGRLNPPTIGHLKMIQTMQKLAEKYHCEARLYLSHSVDKKKENKNPLDYETKLYWCKKAFEDGLMGHLVDVCDSDAKTPIFLLHEIMEEGYTDIVWVGGEDRIGGDGDIAATLTKYNGFEAKVPSMYYKFDSIVFESAGARDENSDDPVTKASASYVRKLALDDDFETFKQMVPFTEKDAYKLFDELREKML